MKIFISEIGQENINKLIMLNDLIGQKSSSASASNSAGEDFEHKVENLLKLYTKKVESQPQLQQQPFKSKFFKSQQSSSWCLVGEKIFFNFNQLPKDHILNFIVV